MKNIKYIVIFILFISSNYIFSQTTPAPTQQPPLELPTFIIEGTAQLDVKAGMKQFPQPPIALTSNELDSLNPLEKQSSLLIPAQPLPKSLIMPQFPKGFLQAQFGLYSTANVLAGYGMRWKGYELYGRAGADLSSGDLKNSDFRRFYLNANSDYIAPDIFWIFGGSRTRTCVNLGYNDYKLYGILSAPQRTTYNAGIDLVSDGNYEGYNFSTGARLYTVQIDDKQSKAFENRVEGFLDVSTYFDNFKLGGNLDLNFGNVNTHSMNFYEIAANGGMYYQLLSIEGEVGFQNTSNTLKSSQSSLMLNANLNFLPSENLTLQVQFFTGLEKQYFSQFIKQNPYFNVHSDIIYPKANGILKAIIHYHPDAQKGASIEGSAAFYEEYPYYNSDSINQIDLINERANLFKINGECFWDITKKDKISADLIFNMSFLNFENNSIPYLPVIEFGANYNRKWFDKLGTNVALIYNSKRFTNRDNTIEIDPYFNLKIGIDYEILKNLKAFAEMQNLTNSNNFVWQGYRERGIFGTIGVNWKF
ncbi:MAG TPA: TonB-dependent receptor [Candidatus Kapabacteria bacterium]|nr:TonB-dependent receptor [Candidatus Kapabacteria bacterium]HOV91580.1 TonB-dependent receptor [Candidatus Kapabacteria bacterium]